MNAAAPPPAQLFRFGPRSGGEAVASAAVAGADLDTGAADTETT